MSAPRGAGGRRRYVPEWPRDSRGQRQRLSRAALIIALAILLASFGSLLLGSEQEGALLDRREDGWYHPAPEVLPRVSAVAVFDGDTLDVRAAATELRIRLFGVDAPERGEPCAAEAAELLARLVAGDLLLLPDERLEDERGRQLRYAFTPAGRSVDAALVEAGLARAWRADGALRDLLVELEDTARRARAGCLWAGG